MGIVDQENSAFSNIQAQAGALNIGGGNSINIAPKFELNGFIGKALSPHRARKTGESLAILNKAISESMSLYMRLSPQISPDRAYVMAVTGLQLTERQTQNLLTVFSSAANELDSTDADNLTDVAKDKILEGASEADDERVRKMWSRLLVKEAREPETFSKRTMTILAEMSHEDAVSFSKLCSSSTLSPVNAKIQLIPVLAADNNREVTYNNGLLSLDETERLAALGLISTTSWMTYQIPPGGCNNLIVNNEIACIRNIADREVEYKLSPIRFLQEGLELSELCEVGSFSNLKQALERAVSTSGLSLEWQKL